MEKRLVGFRRTPSPFVSLYNTIIIDGELCEIFTGQPLPKAAFVPVYEGDAGWEQIEAETKAAEMRN